MWTPILTTKKEWTPILSKKPVVKPTPINNSAFGSVGRTLKEFPSSLMEENAKFVDKVGLFATDILQGTARSVARLTPFVSRDPKLTPQQNTERAKSTTFTPKSGVEKAFFGDQPFSFNSAKEEVKKTLDGFGVAPETSKRYAGSLVFIGSLLDAFPGGSGAKKAGIKGIEEASNFIAKSSKADEIANTLVKTFKLGKKEASEIAPTLVNTKTKEEVANTLKNFVNSKVVIPPRDGMIRTSTKLDEANVKRALQTEKSNYINSKVPELKSYSEKDIAEHNVKVLQAGKEFDSKNIIPKTPLTTPKTAPETALDPKKYKSAEDFVKAQGTPVYHGTDADFKNFESKFLGEANGTAPINKTGFSFSSSPDVAKTFGKNIIEAKIEIKNPFIIDAKGQDYSVFKDILNRKLSSLDKTKYDGIIIKNYQDAGKYGKPTVSDHYIPFSESQIKTKSQLTDIWNKAQEANPLSQEALKYKSAEEFVKAQGNTILHGTDKKFSNFDVKKLGTNEKDFPAQNAFFFTDSLETAQSYGKNIVKRYGKFEKPVTIDAKGKMYGDFREELRTAVENAKKNGNDAVIIKNLSDRKDWGNYEATTHYAVLDTTKLQTKSQLTDIWNKAQEGTKVLPTSKPIPKNLPAELTNKTQATLPKLLQKLESETPQIGKSLKSSLPESIPTSKSVGKTVKDIFTNVVEYVQNTDKRILDLQKGKKITDETNIYQKLTLLPGKTARKVEQGYEKAQGIVSDILSLSKGKDVQASRKELNQYLQALHTPERNLALGEGASGMTTAEAKLITAKATPEIKAIANKALDLNKEVLDMLKNSGVISDELHTTLRTKYKNHVPLQRVMDETEEIGSILGGGLDVKSTGIKAAKGSDREVADILTNITTNYEQAVIRAEKNIVDNATLNFVRANADDLENVMEIVKPKAIGKDFAGKTLMEKTNDPTILQLFENGKPIWIKIKDEKLAIALRGVGREKLGALMNGVASFTRLYSGLATRFNPEFALPNKLRDLQETMTFMASQGDVGLKGALKTLKKDPASIVAVTDAIRGGDSAGAKLYREMQSMGGTTGGMGLSTRKNVELNLEKMFGQAQSKPRMAADKLVGYVDNWNTIFEDSTRLSVYKSALDNGLSKERAAFLAKEASINFNRMGKGGPVINALWMFSNASIQGSTKMIRAMKNPKVAAGVATVVGGSVAAVSEWNNSVDPDWRNKVTKWDRINGLPVMLPSSNGEARYFVIPVSWGIKPILVMSNAGYDALDGQDVDVSTAMGDIMSSVLDAYNPVGGTDLTSALVPTIADTPVEIARNQKWSGSKIKPDSDANAPADIRYFDSLKDTAQGRLAIKATEKLRSAGILLSPADLNYAIDSYISGAGRSMTKTSNLLYGLATKDVPPPDEFPFLSRFYRERSEEETGQGTAGETDKIKAQLSEQSRARFEIKQEAESTYETLKGLPKETAAERFDVLSETNPDLAKKVAEIVADEQLGLTYSDRLIKALGVENGERAKYIAEKFNALKSQEEKAKLWEEYTTKKLITNNIAEQLVELLKK